MEDSLYLSINVGSIDSQQTDELMSETSKTALDTTYIQLLKSITGSFEGEVLEDGEQRAFNNLVYFVNDNNNNRKVTVVTDGSNAGEFSLEDNVKQTAGIYITNKHLEIQGEFKEVDHLKIVLSYTREGGN